MKYLTVLSVICGLFVASTTPAMATDEFGARFTSYSGSAFGDPPQGGQMNVASIAAAMSMLEPASGSGGTQAGDQFIEAPVNVYAELAAPMEYRTKTHAQ